MTNGINATQADIFLFLTKRNNWKTEAETNNDGEISQNEFCKYVNANWQSENMGCETPEHDLIIKFWNKFDTNNANNDTKYLFDKEEIANLEKKLELYEIFDVYLNNIKTPTILSGNWSSVWLNSVKDDLSRLIEVYDGEPEGLKKFLDVYKTEILNKNTALCYAQLAMEKMSNLPEGYDPQYDNTLCMIIVNYASSLAGNSNDDTIKNEIDNIISAYAKTATQGGLSEPDKTLLGKYGYNFNQLNPLQVKKALHELKTNYNSNLYSDNEELFDEYFNAYIYNIEPNQYNSILSNIVHEFKNSEQGKTLGNIIKVLEYKNISNDSEIYDELCKKLGNQAANIIVDNDIDTDFYNDAIDQLIDKIRNGESIDNIETEIINIIIANLNEFQDDLVQKVPADKVVGLAGDIYDGMDFDNDDLSKLQEDAIAYCDLLAQKGGKIGVAIIEVFGTNNYEGEIKKLDRATLKTKMQNLKNKVNNLSISSDEDNKFKNGEDYNWWGQWNDVSMGTNDTLDLTKWNVHQSSTFKNGPLKDYPVTYEYDVVSGGGVCTGSKFNPPSEPGVSKITVTAKIGNIYISHTTFSVNIVEGTTQSEGGTDGTNGTGGTGGAGGTNSNFDNLEAGDYDCAATTSRDCNSRANIAHDANGFLGDVKKVIDKIFTKLINAGYDENILKTAKDKMITLYTNLLNAVVNSDYVGDGYPDPRGISFKDSNNITDKTATIYFGTARTNDTALGWAQEACKSSDYGLCFVLVDNTHYVACVSQEKVFDKFVGICQSLVEADQQADTTQNVNLDDVNANTVNFTGVVTKVCQNTNAIGWSEDEGGGVNFMNKTIDALKSAMNTKYPNIDSAKLNSAITSTKTYYSSLLKAISNIGKNDYGTSGEEPKSRTISFTDEDGITDINAEIMIGNWYEADDAESNAKSSCTKVATGIAVVKKNKGDNKFYLAIAKEKVFEKFKKYFN